MAYVFPSKDWVAQLRAEINHNAAYASSAKNWEGDFYFVVQPAGSLKEPLKLYLDLWHGKCREAHLVTEPEDHKPEFIISGTMDTYRRVFTKKLDPIQALMSRKLKLQGNMIKVMRAVKAALDLVNCASLVDTIYADEVTS